MRPECTISDITQATEQWINGIKGSRMVGLWWQLGTLPLIAVRKGPCS